MNNLPGKFSAPQTSFLREVLSILILCLFTSVMSGILLGAFVMLLSSSAQAAQSEVDLPQLKLNETRQGSLLFKQADHPGIYVSAPTLKTSVSMHITGMLARVRVTQQFTNPTQQWQEGIYVFPLPDDAAVDTLHMQIGERIIEGKIKEKGEARKIYQSAKRAGKKAALIEQQRPNIFTNAVANIGPGETVSVIIEYQQRILYVEGTFSLRFPMVVNPRYTPNPAQAVAESLSQAEDTTVFNAGGWARATSITASRNNITLKPAHPVTMQIELNAGFPLANIDSPYHRINTHRQNDRHFITLAEGSMPADRDFVLRWRPVLHQAPQAALFSETRDDGDYAMLMFMPPHENNVRQANQAREVVFIIDTSGSMGGASIRQARRALQLAVERLNDTDRFNIIQFNSRTIQLFANAVVASRQNRQRALQYIRSLRAGGGTEMLPALQAALPVNNVSTDEGATSQQPLRQIIFLTDGSVSNEAQLFDLIKARLGNSRLFTVGIGAAPNSYFMHKAALFGRGTFTHIGDIAEVEEKMLALFASIEKPVLTNIQTQWLVHGQPLDQSTTPVLESYPLRITDLYAGRPLVVVARLPKGVDGLLVRGSVGQHHWQRQFTLHGGAVQNGVAKRWAREKIASLMNSLHDGARPADVRQAVLHTALQHHLVSKYTSLVAVDVTPSRPQTTPLQSQRIKTPLPKGSDPKTFIGLPRTATAAPVHVVLGMLALLLAVLSWLYATGVPRKGCGSRA